MLSLISAHFKMIEILLFVGIVAGQGRIPLHNLMTEDELRLYFGDQVSTLNSELYQHFSSQTEAEIRESYDLGMIKKVCLSEVPRKSLQ